MREKGIINGQKVSRKMLKRFLPGMFLNYNGSGFQILTPGEQVITSASVKFFERILVKNYKDLNRLVSDLHEITEERRKERRRESSCAAPGRRRAGGGRPYGRRGRSQVRIIGKTDRWWRRGTKNPGPGWGGET